MDGPQKNTCQKSEDFFGAVNIFFSDVHLAGQSPVLFERKHSCKDGHLYWKWNQRRDGAEDYCSGRGTFIDNHPFVSVHFIIVVFNLQYYFDDLNLKQDKFMKYHMSQDDGCKCKTLY